MKNTNNKGITLIALIITVILLIILSAVSIGVIINGDLFGRAKDTVGKANSQIEDSKDKEEQAISVWDALPGKVVKSRTKGESTIELSVVTSDVTTTSFRVHATGTNAYGDILTYALKVGKTTYEEKQGEEVYWDITGLTPATTYEFEVIARDESTENNVISSETTLTNSKPEVTIIVKNITGTTAQIVAQATDTDGDTLTYKLIINGQTYGPNQTSTWNITGLTPLTTHSYTVVVSDGYDEVTKTGTITTIQDNIAPVLTVNSLNSKTTNSLKINAKATDSDGDNLTYKLYTSTSQNGTYTLQQTSSATAQNTQVTLTASNLSQYTTYYWYIEVSDGTDKITSENDKKNARTKCTGTGLTHSTSSCSGYRYVTCTNCGGDKVYSRYCSYIISCSSCGGDGVREACYGSAEETGFESVCGRCGRTIIELRCDRCGYILPCLFCYELNIEHSGGGTCNWCDGTGETTCSHWNATGPHYYDATCYRCNSDGEVKTSCIHGQTSSHRYCTHYNNTTLTSHKYCSHGYTSEHE